jgi:hypothetical protein
MTRTEDFYYSISALNFLTPCANVLPEGKSNPPQSVEGMISVQFQSCPISTLFLWVNPRNVVSGLLANIIGIGAWFGYL